jgi:pantoate--beta-alanine ligase
MRRIVREQPLLVPDYLAVVDADTLSPLRRIRGRVALLGAVRVGATRLMDNVLVAVP